MILFIRQTIGGWFIGIGLILVVLSLASSCESGYTNWSVPDLSSPPNVWMREACHGPAYGATFESNYGTALYMVHCRDGVTVEAADPNS